jgi:hypothetical protein
MDRARFSIFAARGLLCAALLPVAAAGVELKAQQRFAPANAHHYGARELMELANQSRVEAGLAPLEWDAALAGAAYEHALRMAAEGPISHQYRGEPDLAQRASAAGAKFSIIEENVAMGYSPAQIHDAWMHSPGHHDNLMSRRIDRVGVALIPAHGMLYAVADYEESVALLTGSQVEAKIGAMIQGRGLTLVDPGGARRYCALDEGASVAGINARFLMRWQGADLAKLPKQLEQRIASGGFRQAAVGACAAKTDGDSSQTAFTAYRVAVLLY